MPALFITSAPPKGRRPNMALLRAIRDVRAELGTLVEGEDPLMSSQRLLTDVLTAPQHLGDSEDASVLDAAEKTLNALGCGTATAEPVPEDEAPGTPAETVDTDPGTGYSDSQIALIILAHVKGNPQLAASSCKIQERILRESSELEAADIFSDAFDLLVETFSVDEQEEQA